MQYTLDWNEEINPFRAKTPDDVEKRFCLIDRRIKHRQTKMSPILFNHQLFTHAKNDYDRSKFQHVMEFESKMLRTNNVNCYHCRETFIDIVMDDLIAKKYICNGCKNNTMTRKYFEENNWDPIWIDDDKTKHYDIPPELQNLRLAEKMLIQRVSPCIPVVHIKNGVLGLKGHCIAFPQDITSICKELPRVKCHLVRFIRHYGTKKDGITSKFQSLTVRRKKVLDALYWLQKFNHLYHDLIINPSNLDWMKGQDEAELQNIMKFSEEIYDEKEEKTHITSVSYDQTHMNITSSDMDLEYNGALHNKSNLPNSHKERDIVNQLLLSSYKTGNSIPSIDFPQIKDDPINEYDGTSIFANAFPWLFPGGIGDIWDDKRGMIKRIDRWITHLMRYEDHRFENDKLFSFYIADYYQRRCANSTGGIFIKTIAGKCPKTLHDLKNDIYKNKLSFVNKLQSFAGTLKGTDSYWRAKKMELNSWINYHLEHKNGPPTLFITLSCAEYWWPDLKRLILTRIKDKNLAQYNELQNDQSKEWIKAIDEHSGLVQEFFILRFNTWMNTIGKKLLHIKHFWAAFEFASGRGQIHTHLLAITSDQIPRLKQYYSLRHTDPDRQKRTKLMAKYAHDILMMTANHPGKSGINKKVNINDIALPEGTAKKEIYMTSMKKRFCEIENINTDLTNLCNHCQIHRCSNFCMRNKRKSSRKKRICRAGAGEEIIPGSFETTGFQIHNQDCIENDTRGFKSLNLRRTNSVRFIQTGLLLLQTWRANCDVKILIYDTDPYHPDMNEISSVIDYIAAYTCKGHMTKFKEKELIIKFINE